MILQEATETIYQGYLQKNFNIVKKEFIYTKKSISWFIDSERTTTFYKKSLKILKPYLKECKTILDIGCGVGSFSIELAKMGFHTTAIDKFPLVIESLVERKRQMKLENLTPLNISFEDFEFNNKYDIILASYMMGLINENTIDDFLKNTNKHLVLILPYKRIKNDFSISELYGELEIDISNLEQSNYIDIINILDKKNIKYDIEIFKSEFGQSFKNFEEAILFIYHYFNVPKKNLRIVIEWLKRKLIIKNNLYYLPNVKESAMIII